MKNGARQAEFKGGRQAAGRGCADMGKKSKGVFLSLDAVTAMLLLFVVIIISFAYFTVPMTSNFESQLLRMQMQDAATVMSKAGYLPLSLDSSSDAGISGIREVLRATPDSLCVQVSAYGTKQPEGLVGHWKLDESSDSPAVVNFAGGASASRISDYAGTITSKQFGVDESGISGKAMSFNGAECFAIPFTAPTSTHPESFTRLVKDDFTISFWVKTQQKNMASDWRQGAGLVGGYVPAETGDFGISLVGTAPTRVQFGFSSPLSLINSSSEVSDGRWHHIAATASRATGKIYLFFDGVSEASGTAANFSIKDVPRLAVGCRQDEANYFEGSIDELRIYDRVLSAAEIRGLYANPTGAEYVVTKPGCVRQQGAAVQSITIPFIDSRSGENVQYTALLRAWSKSPLQTDTSLLGGLLTQFENITNVSNSTQLCGSDICLYGESCCLAREPNYCFNPSTAVCDACGGVCNPSTQYCNESTGACEPIPNTNVSVVGGCMVLSQPDTTYLLSSDVVSANGSTCFNVTAPDVTLDCQGHSIFVNAPSAINCSGGGWILQNLSNGVYTNQHGTQIRNCVISSPTSAILFSTATHGAVADSTCVARCSYGSGIRIEDGANNALSDSVFNGTGKWAKGITVYRSDSNTFTNVLVGSTNTSMTNDGPFYFHSCKNNTISNSASYCQQWLCKSIEFYNSTNNNISDFTGNGLRLANSSFNIINRFTDTTRSGDATEGLSIRTYSSFNTISSVVLSQAPAIIEDNSNSNQILNCSFTGIYHRALSISSSSDNNISNTNFTSLNGYYALGLFSTNRTRITDSSVVSSAYPGGTNPIGFWLNEARDSRIINTNISAENNTAIKIDMGYNNTFSNFKATSNNESAIYLVKSSLNTFSDFNATANTSSSTSTWNYTGAVTLFESDDNHFNHFEATVKNGTGHSLGLFDFSKNNHISDFNLSSAACVGLTVSRSSNNTLSNFDIQYLYSICSGSPFHLYPISEEGSADNNTFFNFKIKSPSWVARSIYVFGGPGFQNFSNFEILNGTLEFGGHHSHLSNFKLSGASRLVLTSYGYNTFKNFTVVPTHASYQAISMGSEASSCGYNNFSDFTAESINNSAIILTMGSYNIFSNFTARSNTSDSIKIGSQSSSSTRGNVLSNFNSSSNLGNALYIHNARENNISNANLVSNSTMVVRIASNSSSLFSINNTIYRCNISSGNAQGTLLSIDNRSGVNLFYWNNFTNAKLYVNDTSPNYLTSPYYFPNFSNSYSTIINGYSEGNIWGNVINGSVVITGSPTPPSAYGGGFMRGTGGAGYPYNNTTSNMVRGNVVDLAPLVVSPPSCACGVLSTPNYVCTLAANQISAGTCFNVTASNVTINCNGFSITGSNASNTYGIYSNQSNSIIKNCNVRDFDRAIYFDGARNGAITNVTVNITKLNGVGIFLFNSNHTNLSNFNATGYSYALIFSSSSNNRLSNFNATSISYSGLYLGSNSNNNQFSDFTTTSRDWSALRLESSINNTISNFTTISTSNYAVLLISSSNNNRLSNFKATGYDQALALSSSSNNTLSNFTANATSSSSTALNVYQSSNNTFSNFSATGLNYVLYLWSSSNNNYFSNFNTTTSFYHTLYIASSNNNQFSNFNASSYQEALRLDSGSNNTFFNFTAFGINSALYLTLSSNNNQFSNFNATGYSYALIFSSSSNNRLSNFNATSSYSGLYLGSNSNNNRLSSFNLTCYYSGLSLSSSSNNTISNFTIVSQNSDALSLASSSDNTLSNFTVTSNQNEAIYFESSSNNNRLSNFTATAPNYFALYITSSANNAFSNFNATAGGLDALVIVSGSSNIFSNFTATAASGAAAVIQSSSNNVLSNFTATSYSNYFNYRVLSLISSSNNNISRGKLISGSKMLQLIGVDDGSSQNIFYWNNFTDTSGLYVNDTSGGLNFYNTTINGYSEGNIWGNVVNGSVPITTAPFPLSAYGGGWKRGISGIGYPYNSTNSQGMVWGNVVDYAPLKK